LQPQNPQRDDNWNAVNPLEAAKVKAKLELYWKKRKRLGANSTTNLRESAAVLEKIRGGLDCAVKKLKETQGNRDEQEDTIRRLHCCLESVSDEYHQRVSQQPRKCHNLEQAEKRVSELEGALALVTGERDIARNSAATYHDRLALLTAEQTSLGFYSTARLQMQQMQLASSQSVLSILTCPT
jgi:hypothetical protein